MTNHPISFDFSDFNGCCGAFVLTDFEQLEHRYDWGRYRTVDNKELPSLAAVFENFEDKLQEALKREFSDRETEGSKIGYITLVTKYREQSDEFGGKVQLPEFIDYLLISGWRVDRTWVNCNHGNEVTQFSKEFFSKGFERYHDDNGW